MVTMLTVLATAATTDSTSSSDPCCPPLQCRYRPGRVRNYLQKIAEAKADGEEPCEALEAYLDIVRTARYRVQLNGPSRQWAADIVADIDMAKKAGCVGDVAISRYLCPFGELDEARRAAAVDEQDGPTLSCQVVGISAP